MPRNAHLHPLIASILESSLEAQRLTAECIRRVEALQPCEECHGSGVVPVRHPRHGDAERECDCRSEEARHA